MKGSMDRLGILVAVAALALGLAATGHAYEAGPVTDGGAVTGRVAYGGTAPARAKIEITKDASVCGTESEKLSEELIVGAGGGIQNVVVRIANITKGAALAPASPNPVLDQKVCQFRPHVLVFPAGSTLDVLNSDGILHNVHTYGEANAPVNKAQPGFKKKIELVFDKPEFPVRVECDAHPWMRGWLIVQEHPYYALTDESGAFTLANVPAGDYQIEAWHETLGRQTASVSVAAGGQAQVAITFPAK
jgi:plastocyanin